MLFCEFEKGTERGLCYCDVVQSLCVRGFKKARTNSQEELYLDIVEPILATCQHKDYCINRPFHSNHTDMKLHVNK